VNTSIIEEIRRLQALSVAALQDEWIRLYGWPSRSRNKAFLTRRLIWRTQELAYGGLSGLATARLAELAPSGFERAQIPKGFCSAAPANDVTRRDDRLPAPGTIISRRWHGRDLRLLVRDDGGYELDGVVYGSLSEAARGATGQRWGGPLFWGLRPRQRKSR
jgi:hypothetical protein